MTNVSVGRWTVVVAVPHRRVPAGDDDKKKRCSTSKLFAVDNPPMTSPPMLHCSYIYYEVWGPMADTICGSSYTCKIVTGYRSSVGSCWLCCVRFINIFTMSGVRVGYFSAFICRVQYVDLVTLTFDLLTVQVLDTRGTSCVQHNHQI